MLMSIESLILFITLLLKSLYQNATKLYNLRWREWLEWHLFVRSV